ncbi:major facilitator superfamily MFS_1 [Parvibaculum lavamentivorans DS-1]|uniref:Major facilitator superfamily MFS_1 n=1 Tax=Parvibaculum lavamentivorans (strain DS-1 / DSM 13023 / NCIMB 13966) TaxID=402881 RepID=A7HUQ1_PARL1|nr:MFS transporter [Parvibaculum lavamentivorans]ABS63634.1 major facilitator superfamily MFS_1 [Parvibaculum lavamentivorans DS-1]
MAEDEDIRTAETAAPAANRPLRPSDPDRQTTPQERKRAFFILFVCLLSVGMGQTLVFAVLPPIAADLGMSEFETTMIFSLSAALWVLTSTFWGRRSDVMGRKPVILIGVFGFAFSTSLVGFVLLAGYQHWISMVLMFPLVMGARAIFGIFGSGSMPASQAYVADRTTRAERAGSIAQIGAAFGLGTVVGPGIAAAFAEIHILAPFFAVGALAFVSGIAIWILLPERTRPKKMLSEKQEKQAALKWSAPNVMPWLVIGVILSLSQSIMMQLFAFYLMAELGMQGSEATQLVSVGMMAMAMATLVAQLGLIQRFDLSVQFLLRWGAVTMILSFAMLVFGGSYGVLVSALALAGLGFGFLRSGLSAGASLSVSLKDQGAVAGLIGSTAATGHILNPAIGIPLFYLLHSAPFMLGIGLMVMILAFAIFHPVLKNLRSGDTGLVDEEEEEIGLH